MKEQLKDLLAERVQLLVIDAEGKSGSDRLVNKRACLRTRDAEIVRVQAIGRIINDTEKGDEHWLDYQVHFKYLIKHGTLFYIEEELEQRRALFHSGKLNDDWEIQPSYQERGPGVPAVESIPGRLNYRYSRLKAVQYAERWWNEFNPAYPKFTDDCSSFISQCLHAGGVPMWGSPKRSTGWWMNGTVWSYSWTVANALQQLLDRGQGIRTKEVQRPDELDLGDIICMDFQGDGRFDHSLIVTAKDQNGMPLVNAHTTNSRHRYWAYEDSTAYTPNIKYKFYLILDGT